LRGILIVPLKFLLPSKWITYGKAKIKNTIVAIGEGLLGKLLVNSPALVPVQ
jgi:hypothetical protein